MKEKIDWNSARELLLKGQRAKEVFEEPPHWQTRLMRRVRTSAIHAPDTFEMELYSLNSFALKLGITSFLLGICIHTYVLSSSETANTSMITHMAPQFSPVDILWGGQ